MRKMRVTIPLLLAILIASILSCRDAEPSAGEVSDGAEQSASDEVSQPPAPAPPAMEEATRLIAESQPFGDFQFTLASLSIPMDGALDNEVSREPARQLADSGWIEIDGSGKVSLTSRSDGDIRFLVRPNGFLDIVPLASKELIEVESIDAASDGKASATFRWRWIPNEIGESLLSGRHHDRFSSEHRARASLMSTRNGWTVLLIEEVKSEE